MLTKTQITKNLIELLPEQDRIGLDFALKTWWYNIRPNGGLRLTDQGMKIIQVHLNLENWKINFKDLRSILTKKLILDMDRKIQWPYYIDIKKKSIVFFSSRDAMMASLYGDLRDWLENCESRNISADRN